MSEFRIKQHDLLPEITATIKDGTGTPIDLSGGAVKFSMTKAGETTAKINAVNATIVNAAGGQVKYSWAGTDTDTAGIYKAEFEATVAAKKFTAPNDSYIAVYILADLA